MISDIPLFTDSQKILIVDTQLAGHHVLWLCLTAKVMLERGYSVVLVVNQDSIAVQKRIEQIDKRLLSQIEIIASSLNKKTSLKTYFAEINRLFNECGGHKVLFNNFDTMASKLFRCVTFGYKPPIELYGKVSIIYHRPRPLDDTQHSIGESWKRIGLNKLIKSKFFVNIFLLDPFIAAKASTLLCQFVKIKFIPDPWISSLENAICPAEFDLSDCNLKLLQYGVGDKRKGTELLLRAYNSISEPLSLTLIIAGVQKSSEIARLVATSTHKVILIDRFISNAEEKYLFECCDVVAIPYLSHYGSSNILSKAAQYKKPVLASNFHLIGRVVDAKNLGLSFKDQSIDDLVTRLKILVNIKPESYVVALTEYSKTCSFAAFADALSTV
ncbi:MAG: glycosyltransferase [Sphingobacteriaceae bacterium]|nr:glycosyltransferase [Sphingobacteriaceae bacterium]